MNTEKIVNIGQIYFHQKIRALYQVREVRADGIIFTVGLESFYHTRVTIYTLPLAPLGVLQDMVRVDDRAEDFPFISTARGSGPRLTDETLEGLPDHRGYQPLTV